MNKRFYNKLYFNLYFIYFNTNLISINYLKWIISFSNIFKIILKFIIPKEYIFDLNDFTISNYK